MGLTPIFNNRDKKNRILTIVRPGVVFGQGEGGNMSRLVKLIHNFALKASFV